MAATIMAGFDLARRLGIGDGYADYVRTTVTDPGGDLGFSDALDAVAAELRRRNWEQDGHPGRSGAGPVPHRHPSQPTRGPASS